MNTTVRMYRPDNYNEQHHHTEVGPSVIEVYVDDKLVARFLTQNVETQKNV